MTAHEVISRRKRRRAVQLWWDAYREYILIAGIVLLIAGICTAVFITGTGGGKDCGQIVDKPTTTMTAEGTADTSPEPETSGVYPYNTMSADWGGEDVAGFTLYAVPQAYAENGGELPEVVQVYTYCLCQQKSIDFATVLGLIEVESAYKWDAVSKNGAKGYMQIMESWHEDRMKRLGVSDILNPYQNISTGLDYLEELLEKYGWDYEKALTAYRWGPSGAYRDYFSAGQSGCDYSEAVLAAAERIRNGGEEK